MRNRPKCRSCLRRPRAALRKTQSPIGLWPGRRPGRWWPPQILGTGKQAVTILGIVTAQRRADVIGLFSDQTADFCSLETFLCVHFLHWAEALARSDQQSA